MTVRTLGCCHITEPWHLTMEKKIKQNVALILGKRPEGTEYVEILVLK